MTGYSTAMSFAGAIGLAALLSTAAAAPAAANSIRYSGKQARISAHHAAIRHQAYRAGYNRGWRDGHLAAAEPRVVTGRSAALVAPYGGPFDNGGLLGTGVLGGDGVLGTGVLSGRGALGVGILGF